MTQKKRLKFKRKENDSYGILNLFNRYKYIFEDKYGSKFIWITKLNNISFEIDNIFYFSFNITYQFDEDLNYINNVKMYSGLKFN